MERWKLKAVLTQIELRPIPMRSIAGEERVDFGKMAEELLRNPPGKRSPYVACTFISTIDGRATLGGSTENLGFHADTRVLMRLRTFADAVIIGAGTMRVERYGRLIPEPRLREYREQIGLPPDPLTVIVSDSLDLPWDAGLFTDGHGKVLIATTAAKEPPPTATEVELLRFDGLDFAGLLNVLARDWGVRSLVCEGGPTVLHALIAAGLVDDLFLTVNPVLVGSGERSLTAGPLAEPAASELVWALETEGELFTRWRIGKAEAGG